MLRDRLWMGAVLVALTAAVLLFDARLAPWHPFLFLLVGLLSLVACHELLTLLNPARRPPRLLSFASVAALLVAGWAPHIVPAFGDVWLWVAGAFALAVLAGFLWEMRTFTAPGGSVTRLALGAWLLAYLGLLPCFLAQLRWLPDPPDHAGAPRGTIALALAIFVPKFCDVGAYFTGRFLGRHKMTPVLSPKKTWEGFAGGLTASVLTTVGLAQLGPVFGSLASAVGFGLVVGLVGVLGDLAESLVKRDCQAKDASQVVPGFGGVLDVVDSIVFSAPVVYLWLR